VTTQIDPSKDGAAYLRHLYREFQFKEPERSLAVAVAASETLFARRLLSPFWTRPGFFYTANAAGGGKTVAADAAIAPVLGKSPRTQFPRKEEELEKLLLAEVLSGSGCLFFDNVKGAINSASIEGILTSHNFKGRILNQSKTFEGDNNLVLFFTGNGVTVSEDLARRVLFVELFQPEARSQDRKFETPLSVGYLLEHRREILAALWQIVDSWDKAGRPEGSTTHASFPEWSRIIGGMVEHAGFASPVTAPALSNGGNQDLEDMMELVKLIRQTNANRPIDFEKLAGIAAEHGLFERVTDGNSANTMDRSDKAKFGRLLKGYDARTFGDDRLTFYIDGKGHSRRFRVSWPVETTEAGQ